MFVVSRWKLDSWLTPRSTAALCATKVLQSNQARSFCFQLLRQKEVSINFFNEQIEGLPFSATAPGKSHPHLEIQILEKCKGCLFILKTNLQSAFTTATLWCCWTLLTLCPWRLLRFCAEHFSLIANFLFWILTSEWHILASCRKCCHKFVFFCTV